MNFTFPKKSEFNSNDLHNIGVLERILKKKIIIIFIEPHNVLLRLAGGFNLLEEFLTNDNVFFLKPLTYEQREELQEIIFRARLSAGWEKNNIFFSKEYKEKLLDQYTKYWKCFSRK
jgi:hypothetical protein